MQNRDELPLTPRELRIVRGMIDEHVYELRKRQQWRGRFGDFRKILASVAVVGMLALQAVAIFWK